MLGCVHSVTLGALQPLPLLLHLLQQVLNAFGVLISWILSLFISISETPEFHRDVPPVRSHPRSPETRVESEESHFCRCRSDWPTKVLSTTSSSELHLKTILDAHPSPSSVLSAHPCTCKHRPDSLARPECIPRFAKDQSKPGTSLDHLCWERCTSCTQSHGKRCLR